MSAVAVEGAILAGMLPRRLALGLALVERSVEPVFVPLTRLSHSKSEQTTMQPPKHITIHLIDHKGVILDRHSLSKTTRLIDLEVLRCRGVSRVEVPRAITTKQDMDSAEWAGYSAQKNKNEDFGIAGEHQ
ncbi:hypothetical protein D3C84_668880 [compost metagenome]